MSPPGKPLGGADSLAHQESTQKIGKAEHERGKPGKHRPGPARVAALFRRNRNANPKASNMWAP